MPSTWVYVASLPECDLCRAEKKTTTAEFDGKTVFGPWAYMCKAHFEEFGTGLGIGRGQRLVLRDPE